MKATRGLLLLASLLALSSCGIPATGVVEAGDPASGIPPVTQVYFVASGMRALTRTATRQVICTAGAAHRLGTPAAGPVTVLIASDSGRHAEGSDEDCPAP
jgi:hypothetical protein